MGRPVVDHVAAALPDEVLDRLEPAGAAQFGHQPGHRCVRVVPLHHHVDERIAHEFAGVVRRRNAAKDDGRLGMQMLEARGHRQTPLDVHHPVEIDPDELRVDRSEQRVHVDRGVLEQNGGEVQDPRREAAVSQVALERLEADREVLVERRDRHVARGAEVREVDVVAFAEVEEGRRMEQQQVNRRTGKPKLDTVGHRAPPHQIDPAIRQSGA